MPRITRESSVTQARKEAVSFRTTIPKAIAEQLKIEHRDKLVWEVEPGLKKIKATVYRKKQ